MFKAYCLVLLVIGVVTLPLEVNAQPTVDYGGSCEFPTFDETARDVKLTNIARDVEEVKNLLASRQQYCSAVDSSSLCECKTNSLACECSGLR